MWMSFMCGITRQGARRGAAAQKEHGERVEKSIGDGGVRRTRQMGPPKQVRSHPWSLRLVLDKVLSHCAPRVQFAAGREDEEGKTRGLRHMASRRVLVPTRPIAVFGENEIEARLGPEMCCVPVERSVRG